MVVTAIAGLLPFIVLEVVELFYQGGTTDAGMVSNLCAGKSIVMATFSVFSLWDVL